MSQGTKSRTGKRKNYHHGDLRGALLEAVRGLVERDGPDGFSIAEACRAAGVSTAAPYKHFSDRADILRGVAFAGMGRLRDAMEAAAAAHAAGDPERIAAMGRAYVTFAAAEPGVFRLIFGLTGDHAGHEELEAAGEGTIALVERVVAEHLDIPADGPEAQLRAYALWCFVHGHSFLTLDGKAQPHEGVSDGRLLALVGEALLPPRGAG